MSDRLCCVEMKDEREPMAETDAPETRGKKYMLKETPMLFLSSGSLSAWCP